MVVIDADAHVVETRHTWEFVEPSQKQFKPVIFTDEQNGRETTIIDGRVTGQSTVGQVFTAQRASEFQIPPDRRVSVSEGAFAMENVEARIADMDEFEVDIQVLQPTLFLRPYSERVDTQVALCGAYARWMAYITKDHQDRLRWAVPLPVMSMPDSIDLMRFAHANGAVSVFMRPFETNWPIYDPYFDALYDEAVRLDMAIGVHVGNGRSQISDYLSQHVGFGLGFLPFVYPTTAAFHGTIASGLPLRHPKLRIGFLEASASWVPWLLNDLRRRAEGKKIPEGILRDYRLFIACMTTDDLPYLTAHPDIGEDNLVIGTDYGHTDVASEVDAISTLKTMSELSPTVTRKILEDTPARLYAI